MVVPRLSGRHFVAKPSITFAVQSLAETAPVAYHRGQFWFDPVGEA
jgi:hypothetical protein